MKTIPLTKGRVAVVSDRDFAYLNQWKWYAMESHGLWYAARNARKEEDGSRTVLMHRVLREGEMVDHRDGNGLHNFRSNLRSCSNHHNLRNRGKQRNNTSGFKGVTWQAGKANKWKAQLHVMGRNLYLGLFVDPIDAARAYNRAARKYHGKFAKLNLLP